MVQTQLRDQSKPLGEPLDLPCQPLQDVLLVLCDPLDVGPGPLDGLIQGQRPRTKSNFSIVLLKLQQLLTKAAEKVRKMPSKEAPDRLRASCSQHSCL